MNIDNTIIAAFIGILGVLLGSLLSGAGYLYKNRIENIRIVHKNIFYLMKLFHLTCASKNIEKGSSLYIKKIERYFHDNENQKITNEDANELCSNFLLSLINPIWHQLDNDFRNSVNNALIELSEVNPVTAYGLSKNSYFEFLVKQINDLLSSSKNTQNMNGTIQEKEFNDGFMKGLKASQNYILNEFASKLDKGIKRISWNANFLYFLSCRFEIKKIKNRYIETELNNFLDEYIKNNLASILENYKNRSQKG